MRTGSTTYLKRFALSGASIILLLGIWSVYASHIDNVYILPGPKTVLMSIIDILSNTETYVIIGTSLFRLIISFIISTLMGITLGLLAGNYPSIDSFLKPIISTLRTLPIASIIILMIILFTRQTSLYIITFLMIFPLVYEAAKHGVLHIPKALKDHMAIEQHPKWVVISKVQLPIILPYIKTSMFQSIGLGFKVIVMAEFISQAKTGIGRELYNGSISINYERVFAWTFIMIFMVILFESLLKIYKAYDQAS